MTPTETEKLLPCPFCRSEAVLRPAGEPYYDPSIQCANPACECRVYAATQVTCIRRWNARPAPAPAEREKDELYELRKELAHQWDVNHAEHCRGLSKGEVRCLKPASSAVLTVHGEWTCHWPMPDLLAKLSDDELRRLLSD